MADQPPAWPQDDAGAREALLAWLEGRLPLDEAADTYARCFPPAAGMDPAKIKATWGSWSAARRRLLAQQIRRSMGDSLTD